ncbi:MAG TPA: winged helix-turn-helix domain-containing protein [Candidatus Thermoplasmatota archaeon]|nr:winged helix-turn-helix domain-containing protein [Candidatus Thermoplasmatota archaeon]
MVEANEFDVYQTDAGYVAVTNPVRRQILAALAKKERDLTELVGITGKAKPTLSNLHVRELIGQGLIEEVAHPTDARKKIYRLKAHHIGSSSVPIEQLRGAVKHYVSLSPLAHALPLPGVLEVLVAAGPKSLDVVHRQAAKLGELSSQLLAAPDARELLPRIAAHWEREGVTRTARIDLEHLALDVEINPRFADSKEATKLVAQVLAGFLEGVLRRTSDARAVRAQVTGDKRARVSVA